MEIVPVSALRDNYIWALTEGENCIVVDPGDHEPVERFLDKAGCKLSAILVTHHHNDHISGIAALAERRDVPVYGPASRNIPCVTHPVQNGDRIELESIGRHADVIGVPGHTVEHIAWLIGDALFCGDTLFAAGCGRLLGGTAAQLHSSLSKLAELPPQTQICCAHEYTLSNLRFALTVEPGNQLTAQRLRQCEALRAAGIATLPSRLADELGTNPFLRTHEDSVKLAAEAAAGQALHGELEVFTALRAWKDRF